MRKPRVFVSSTTEDLRRYRDAVKQELLTCECEPIVQEHFRPDHRSIADMLKAKIQACDAVVVLVGFAFGAAPDDNAQRSFTQMEYDIARQLKKRTYAFVASDRCPLDSPLEAIRQRQGKRQTELQDRHRAQVMRSGGPRYEMFDEAPQLRTQAARLAPVLRDALRRRTVAAASLAGVAALLLLALTVAFARHRFRGEQAAQAQPRPVAAEYSWQRLPAAGVLQKIYADPAAPEQRFSSADGLLLDLEVEGRRDGESEYRIVSERDALRSGVDRYRIRVAPKVAGYLYVFQVDAAGRCQWLFPKNSTSELSSGQNPVEPGRTLHVPTTQDGQWRALVLDDTEGVEHIHAVLYPVADPQLEQALAAPPIDPAAPSGEQGPLLASVDQIERVERTYIDSLRGAYDAERADKTRGALAVVDEAPESSASAAEEAPTSRPPIDTQTVVRWFRHVSNEP